MFGQSFHLDLYECENTDDLEKCYRFLEELVDILGMTQAGSIYLVHGPVKFEDGQRIELYPEKAGVSGFVPLIESGISIHTLSPRRFITLDIYSCKPITPKLQEDCIDACRFYFGCQKEETYFLERGVNYESHS